MTRWRAARYAAGALCAVAALYAFAVNVEWPAVFDAFRLASLPWTAAAAASVLLTLALVTLRWGLLVGASPPNDSGFKTERRGTRWRVLWDSVVLGQAVNILVPLRFGEGARLAVTSRGLDVPVGRVTVGLALERAFDVVAFATIVMVLVASGGMPGAFRGLLPAAATVTLATMGFAVLFVRFVPGVLAWLRRHVGLPAPAAAWIETQESAMRGGWTDVTRRRPLAGAALLTALIPVTAAATNLLVLRGFSLPVPAVTALVLLVVLQIGTAVVSVPGNIGVFHYLTVVTLAAWGVPKETAVATAIVLHAVTLGPKVVLGAFSARRRSVSPGLTSILRKCRISFVNHGARNSDLGAGLAHDLRSARAACPRHGRQEGSPGGAGAPAPSAGAAGIAGGCPGASETPGDTEVR